MNTQFRGAFTALVTPMHDNGDVDYEGFRRLVAWQLEEGIDGLVPLGTTGETPTLDEHEEEKLIRIAVEETRGKIPLIIGAGSNSTRHMTAYVKRAGDLGADAALVVTPYYNKPNDSGLIKHFEAAAATGVPVIIYNIESRTGRNISAPLMEKLAAIPGIIGVKEASGDINQMGDIIANIARPRNAAGNPFRVLSGDDSMTLPLLALGGDGVISVISNLIPRKVRELVRAGLDGNHEESRRLHYELLPFMKNAFVETNPVPVKEAMSWIGLPAGPIRLPLGPLSQASREILRKTLSGLGYKV